MLNAFIFAFPCPRIAVFTFGDMVRHPSGQKNPVAGKDGDTHAGHLHSRLHRTTGGRSNGATTYLLHIYNI